MQGEKGLQTNIQPNKKSNCESIMLKKTVIGNKEYLIWSF